MFESLLSSAAKELTLKFGIAGIVICLMGWLIAYLIKKLLADKDALIKSLTEENKEYRDKFIVLMDKHFNFVPEKEGEKIKK